MDGGEAGVSLVVASIAVVPSADEVGPWFADILAGSRYFSKEPLHSLYMRLPLFRGLGDINPRSSNEAGAYH